MIFSRMRLALIFIALGMCAVTLSAQDHPQVTFLPQHHSFNGILNDRNQMISVARSQWMILMHLHEHRNAAVYWEGRTEPLDQSRLHRSRIQEIQSIFPNRIPPRAEQMTEAQIRFLALHGAEEIAIVFGLVNRIERTEDKERLEVARDLMKKASRLNNSLEEWMERDPTAKAQVTIDRERATMGLVAQDAKLGRPVILVFGLGHDFKQAATEQNMQIHIPSNFQAFLCERFFSRASAALPQ